MIASVVDCMYKTQAISQVTEPDHWVRYSQSPLTAKVLGTVSNPLPQGVLKLRNLEEHFCGHSVVTGSMEASDVTRV